MCLVQCHMTEVLLTCTQVTKHAGGLLANRCSITAAAADLSKLGGDLEDYEL